MTTRVGDWLTVLDSLYDPAWAEPWDAVGLVTGDPDAPADRALFAVDPVEEVVAEAESIGARLLVTHHPLLLRPVHGIAATSYKGRLVERLVRAGIALVVVHTNADVAPGGVSDTLAGLLGVTGARPLRPGQPGEGRKLVTFVPRESADALINALAAAGAGLIGDYRRCAWTTEGTGTFLAGETTNPSVGERGEVNEVPEVRVEMVFPARCLPDVVSALRRAHPYEEPAYDVLVTVLPHGRGLGRVGDLSEPTTVEGIVERATAVLPATAAGVRATGEAHRPVRRLAACGGAGDDLIDAALAAGADAYLTADLRHHPAREAAERGLALVDVSHWASEWPWLADARRSVVDAMSGRGHNVAATVSDQVTDPWSGHRPGGTPASP